MKNKLLLRFLFASIFIFSIQTNVIGQDNPNTTCDQALPACPDEEFGQDIVSEVGGQSASENAYYGCLSSQPNPLWYYIQISESGNAMFDLTQYEQPNQQGNAIDVDFALWGPFTSQDACNDLTEENLVDSSYDAAGIEFIDFYQGDCVSEPTQNPQEVIAGQWYVLLITNYSGQPGYINLTPSEQNEAGFNCSILGETYPFCDIDGDGVEEVNLEDPTILNDITGGDPNVGVTFHASSDDAWDYINPLQPSQQLTAGNDLTVYARRLDFTTSEISVIVVTFTLIPQPEVQNASLSYCDNNGDGVELFDLTIADFLVNADEEYNITYYTSQEDADTGNNPIDTPDYYESGNAVVYVRVEAVDCWSTAEISLEVLDTLTLNTAEDAVCDTDGDGLATFDLNDYSSTILGSVSADIRYYENEADAIAGNDNYITDTENYETGSVVLYAYVAGAGGCNATTTVTLSVNDAPILTTEDLTYDYCDNLSDGTETIDLTVAVDDIIDDATGFDIYYFTNEADAQNGNLDNAIDNPNNYEISATTTIYILVAVDSCSSYVAVTYTLGSGLSVSNDTLWTCNDGSGQATFDLTTASLGNYPVVSYHTSEADAISGNNPIQDPENYSASLPTTVYAHIQDGDCSNVAEISLDYFAEPDITIPVEFAICSGTTANVDAGTQFVSYAWSTGETTQTIEIDTLGSYWVDLTDENGCTYRHNFEVVSGLAPEVVNVEEGMSSLTVIAEGGVEPYEYSIGGFVYQDSNVFNNLTPGTYNIYVRGADGCVSMVELASVLEIPTLFTPNGDGINDVYRMPGLDVYPGSKVRIFDRYGAIIYEGNINNNDIWDGRDMSGNLVSTQDYWYIIDVSDGRQITGHVTVKNRTARGQ